MSAGKSIFKRLFPATVLFAIFLIMSPMRSYAVPGLTISVQDGTNIVLGWPSTPGTTYLIQYASSLSTNTEWEDLTNFYPASLDSNWTSFTVTNAIPACGGSDTNSIQSNGPPAPDDEMAGGAAMSVSSASSATNGIPVPPSPWIPATLPNGAILEPDGTYVPLSPPRHSFQSQSAAADGVMAGGFASPDDGTNGSGCEASGSGFFRVVANGVTCIGITNNEVVSGTVTIPLEIAAPNGDPITGAMLWVDGAMTPGGAAIQGTNNLWTFTWDTTEVANGPHQLSVVVVFGEDATDVEMTNSLAVSVSNVLSFPYYYSQVFGQGEEMWVYAQSAITNIDWEIVVYDSNTNYLGGFSDYSPDGLIDVVWGLQTNDDSPPSQSPSFLLEYYLFDADTGEPVPKTPSAPVASKWAIGEGYWDPSGMMVACSPIDANSIHTSDVQLRCINGVVNTCTGQVHNGLYPQCCNIADGNVWTWGANGNAQTLMQDMPNCNFMYYFGHGTPYSFGINSSSHLTYHDLVTNLDNFPASNVPTNSHPYKLVWIDGCMSAGGPLCEGFGIPSGQYDTNYFLFSGVRTRAYVGYTKEISFNPDQYGFRENMMASFWNNWWGNHSVNYMVTNCQQAFSVAPMDSSAIIYGATNMAVFTY
jgi:hypothetical protein